MDNSCKSEFKELNLAAKIILSSWYGLAGLAAIIGNAIVLWLVVRNESLRTISNLFLASLAAADFVVGLVIDPVWIFTRCVGYDANSHVQTYGEVIDYLWIHTTVATTFNLCCVTMDRYLAILYPLRYQDILTKRRCYILIVTIWFISFILPCSRFFVKDGSVSLWLSFTIITVLIPMMIIIFCSVRILKAAAEQSKKIRNNYTVQSQESQGSEKRKEKLKGGFDNWHCGGTLCCLLVTKSNHIFGELFYPASLWPDQTVVILHSVVISGSSCFYFVRN